MKIGLLPLYLELYDRMLPEARGTVAALLPELERAYREFGVEVVVSSVCRLAPEFGAAVAVFERDEVDAIVTVHLSYSPSLESAAALAATTLPIVVLDTTVDYDFGLGATNEMIMANHGVHGVQDMCNLLRRNNKLFFIEAGHWSESDVVARSVRHLRAVALANKLRLSRVGVIGSPFKGMGDFCIPFELMREAIGFEVVQTDAAALSKYLVASEAEIRTEMDADLSAFIPGEFSPKAHRDCVRASLAVKRWLNVARLDAFTCNFLDFPSSSGFPTVPFVAACKAMAKGVGYAGEGDALCAAMTGALLSQFPETTFTEMFCPDWKGGTVFMSHMGEINPAVAAGRPELLENSFPIAGTNTPLKLAAALKPGMATLVNLAPGPDGTFTLIAAPVEALDASAATMTGCVRGWLKPETPLEDFLAAYSLHGGTHHLSLTYGDIIHELAGLAELMDWEFVVV